MSGVGAGGAGAGATVEAGASPSPPTATSDTSAAAGAHEVPETPTGDPFRFVFVHGLAAVGKYTVSVELAKLSGLKLFHNHLVCDALLAVFEFGSPEFIKLRESMWFQVFAAAASRRRGGLIFTFCPESTVRPGFLRDALATVREASGGTAIIDIVELVADRDTMLARVDTPQRRQFGKLVDAGLYTKLLDDGSIAPLCVPETALGAAGTAEAVRDGTSRSPDGRATAKGHAPREHRLGVHTFDTTTTPPTDTAEAIAKALGLRSESG